MARVRLARQVWIPAYALLSAWFAVDAAAVALTFTVDAPQPSKQGQVFAGAYSGTSSFDVTGTVDADLIVAGGIVTGFDPQGANLSLSNVAILLSLMPPQSFGLTNVRATLVGPPALFLGSSGGTSSFDVSDFQLVFDSGRASLYSGGALDFSQTPVFFDYGTGSIAELGSAALGDGTLAVSLRLPLDLSTSYPPGNPSAVVYSMSGDLAASATIVPEPATGLLLGLGLLGLALSAHPRRQPPASRPGAARAQRQEIKRADAVPLSRLLPRKFASPEKSVVPRSFNALSCMLATSAVAGVFQAAASSADMMLEPVSATTNMGELLSVGPLGNSINQSGLSLGYTSGVTDFDAYLAGSPTHSSAPGNDWVTVDATTGHVDFDLGAVSAVGRAAIWNAGCSSCDNGFAIQHIDLLASLDTSFASPVLLGSYTVTHSTTTGVLAQVLSFAPTSARFIRMEILSNYGSPDGTALGEVAFAVPEPASLALLGLGLAGLGFARRRSA